MNARRAFSARKRRALTALAGLLVLSIVVTPAWVLRASAAGSIYYVAPCGDDQNTGSGPDCGSASGPLKTIQRAADLARAGDTVKILPGVYRETVTIRVSGAADAPITFEAADGPGTALIYGSENSRSFTWRNEGGGLYSTDISQLPRAPELVFERGVASNAFDGQPNYPEITFFREIGDGVVKYPKAHEPDFTINTRWKYHETWATADGGIAVWDDTAAKAQCPTSPQDAFLDCMSTKQTENSSLYYLTDRNTGGDGVDLRQYPDLVGAAVYMLDTRSAFYNYRREVTSFSRSEGKIGWTERADFDYMTGIPAIGPFAKYYIEGKREFLDRPMEWFVEGSRLYIKTRTGASPDALDIEIATRDKGIDFSDQSHLTFRDLCIYFVNNALKDDFDIQYGEGALLAFNFSGSSDYTTIDRVTIAHSGKAIKFRQPNVNKGLLSQHVTLKNSEIFDIEGIAFANASYSYDDGQTGAFPYLTIDSNHIHHIGFKPVIWAPYAIRLPDAYKVIVTNNYIHDIAHKCLQITKTRGEYILVKDNYLERCGLNHSEASGAGIQHWGHVFTTTLFMGNVVRGNRGWTYASANNYWDGGKNYNGVGFFRGMSGIGLNQDGGEGLRVYRNILIDNSMLCVAASPGYKSNNLCLGSDAGFAGGHTYSPEGFPFVVQNNIFVDNYVGIETYPTDPALPTIDYNLYEQAQSIRDNPYSSWNLPGHLVYPVAGQSAAQNTYGRVCDPSNQADSICYNTPWEDHGVENDHQAIFVDPSDLTTTSIFTLKAKLALAADSKAIDAGTAPTDMLAVIAELERGLGINIEDEQLQGSAYDSGPFEYRGSATFADVPFSHPYHDDIEALYQAGYTAGCATNPLRYCPDQAMNRAESAVFVERGVHAASYDPPVPSGQIFADLGLESWAAKWVNGLWEDRYTTGCGTDPLVYCPWQGHTRAEGCVFYLRMLRGSDYEPPTPTQQTFADVPLEAWYAKWVQAGYDAGLIPACQTSPDLRFCPDSPLSRGLAAHMLVQAKGLGTP